MDASSLFRVDGIVAVISGGGTGIGFMMAKALAGSGAKKVYILGRRQAVLKEAASAHPSISPLVCDVTSKDSLQSVVDIISKEVGYINLLIANSGVFGPANTYDSKLSIQDLRKNLFDDVDMDEMTHCLHVNITGAYFTIAAFLDLLDAGNKNAVKGGFGKPFEGSKMPSIQSQVVVTSSLGAYSRDANTPPAYAAAKAGILQLAQHAATNLAPYQIRVNTLAPGYYLSEMAAPVIASRDPETEGIDHPAFMPARRFGVEDEMAGSILYLASKAGAYCDGLVFAFDGGRLSVIPSTY
ncbi:short-chain dehydrogenase [Xylariaceae sp. FL1272]|nr:short-chain dehydrogenase [Xylariaceae sp. FL1272]